MRSTPRGVPPSAQRREETGASDREYPDKVDTELWIVLAGTVLTLFFSVAHYTLRNPSRVRLEQAFAQRRRIQSLPRVLDDLDGLLLATGVLRTFCHLVIMLATVHMFGPEWFNWPAVLAPVAVAWVVVMIFGVALPHAWAKYLGEKTVAAVWPALGAMQVGFWPAGKLLTALDVLVRRLSGHREEPDSRASNVEKEILQLVNEGQAGGGVDPAEGDMIESIIEFRDTTVGEIMTPRTDTVAIDVASDLNTCRVLIESEGHSRIPVYEGTLDTVVGVLYAKDLLNQFDRGDQPFDLRQVMRKPYFVPETKTLADLLGEFKATKVHMAIVLDEYGGTAGLVTIEDLLEEIVGDIADEYEQHEPEMLQQISEQAVEVDARLHIDDLNDALEVAIPEEEDYDTVGGFVFSTLGYVPTAGDTFEHNGAKFTVTEADQRRVIRVKVELTAPAQKPAETETH